MPDYDVIVLGAGLSGLSAGIRLAYGGRRVAVFERHCIPGGLNSYYTRKGVSVDVGLHAMTNYVPEGERSAPMNKLFRQLKLKRSGMGLCPQSFSEVQFPGMSLRFGNSPEELQSEVSRLFPEDAEAFRGLCERIGAYTYAGDEIPEGLAREVLAAELKSPRFQEMLLCPVMFYGNPRQNDMTFRQFCVMFKSIFLEGMARPHDGMRPFISSMLSKYRELGGELFLGKGVSRILMEGGRASGVLLDDGTTLSARAVISSAGACETGALCTEPVPSLRDAEPGRIAFVEAIFELDRHPSELGLGASIIFRNNSWHFDFRAPEKELDLRSQIICFPGNFLGCEDIPAAKSVRITSLASPEWWASLERADYLQAKRTAAEHLREMLACLSPELPKSVLSSEISTPRTITRFTGHVNGAIYGSPQKRYQAVTECPNLYLCGSDQGFLGIIGAMMSGTVVANQLELRTPWNQ